MIHLRHLKRLTYIFAHLSLFIVFFWFGLLKVLGTSPAMPLVDSLRAITISWWPLGSFGVFLGSVEMLIGILFLFRKTEKLAMLILIPHMITAVLPLFMLPAMAWSGFLVPTLEGQYIIKNIVIIALSASIVIGYRRS